MKLVALALVCLACCALCSSAQYDAAGNVVGSVGGPDSGPGTKLKEINFSVCTGVAFDRDTLYVLANPNIFELDSNSGAVKRTITLTGLPSSISPFGLGWDSNRKEFVIADTLLMSVQIADATGKVTRSVSTAPAGDRNVGAAYDACHDGYWITAWNTNRITLYDAASLRPLKTIDLNAAGATRAAGTACSAENHLVYTHSRNTKRGYVFDAGTGGLLYSYPLVYSGSNNGQGSGWWHRWQCPVVFDYEQKAVTWTDAGLPRVHTLGGVATVSVGKSLTVYWESGSNPGKAYAAAAAFAEGWLYIGKCRYFPLALDQLFALTAPPNQLPTIFRRFTGLLDATGSASGAVAVPAAAPLVGIKLSIAMVVLDSKAPQSVAAVSGAWQLTVAP